MAERDKTMAERYKNKYRIQSTRLKNGDYGSDAMYFVTICSQNREHYFGDIVDDEMQLSQLGMAAEKYWSEITNIPISQFYKTYSKPSVASKGKKDSLPFGTFDIYVCDTKLFLTIMGWIEGIKRFTIKQSP